MKENEYKNLIEKYKEGSSTLKEEQFLIDNANHSEPSLEAWYTFVKKNKTETPKGLNDKLWKSFQKNKTSKKRRFIRVLSAAASVLILISFFITTLGQEEQSYSEKERLLNQALGMFDGFEQEEVQHNVFYENDMIILYTTIE